jgi:glutaredoxin-like protein
MNLLNREGQSIPTTTFMNRNGADWNPITTDQLFTNKRVIVFSLPGAFTPTCSSSHLPRYNQLASTFKENNIDDIVCVSVNDGFVMESWGQDQDASNITLLADGNGSFTDGMGMLVDKSDIGFGKRSWRYSMLVDNGVIEKMFIEEDVPGDPFLVSDADTMLNYINAQETAPDEVPIFTKAGCPQCHKAKELLSAKGFAYEEIEVGSVTTMASLRAVTGKSTVPQVFINGTQIGDGEALTKHLG